MYGAPTLHSEHMLGMATFSPAHIAKFVKVEVRVQEKSTCLAKNNILTATKMQQLNIFKK